jgi:hypothetical protein
MLCAKVGVAPIFEKSYLSDITLAETSTNPSGCNAVPGYFKNQLVFISFLL